MIAPALAKAVLAVGAVAELLLLASIQTTSITIDPTFWIAFFGFLSATVTAVIAYKTSQKTKEIATKVDGAKTAMETEMASLRDELRQANKDLLLRADAAPAPASAPAAPGEPTLVKVVDTSKPLEVDQVEKKQP